MEPWSIVTADGSRLMAVGEYRIAYGDFGEPDWVVEYDKDGEEIRRHNTRFLQRIEWQQPKCGDAT